MRVAVVAHVEWIEFARVPRMPEPGKIVHAASGGATGRQEMRACPPSDQAIA